MGVSDDKTERDYMFCTAFKATIVFGLIYRVFYLDGP